MRRARLGLIALACAALWALAAHALWHSSVPAHLKLPHISESHLFGGSYLHRSSSYERFLGVDGLLSILAVVGALAIYARRGHALMRESAAGRVGTGMLLGMLGFAVVWLAELPFGVAAVWWERRHGVSHQSYASALLTSFLSLGVVFLFVSIALLITMGIAARLRRWWWTLSSVVFVGLALLSSVVSIYLIPNTRALPDRALAADARTLAARERVPGTRVVVQEVHRRETSPNAEAVGIGATRRVILWDTLLDGRFRRSEVDVVIAHELGHIAHRHILTRVGWYALFLIPATALVALATRGRGGLYRPEAVPLALFVFVLLQLLSTPLMNVVSRREEAEADWSALQATRTPAVARSLFENLAKSSLADPDPPTWSYVLYDTHPTIAQRIAMVRAWEERRALPSRATAQR